MFIVFAAGGYTTTRTDAVVTQTIFRLFQVMPSVCLTTEQFILMVGPEVNGSLCFPTASMFSEAESHCNGVLKMYFLFAGDFQVALNLSRLKEALVSEGFVPVIVIIIIMFYHTTNTIKTKKVQLIGRGDLQKRGSIKDFWPEYPVSC